MPITMTLRIPAPDITEGDRILMACTSHDESVWYEVNEVAQEHARQPHERSKRGSAVAVRTDREVRLLPRRSHAVVDRDVLTFADVTANSVALLSSYCEAQLAKAKAFPTPEQLASITAASPSRTLAALRWELERFVHAAKTAEWWLRVDDQAAALRGSATRIVDACRIVEDAARMEAERGPQTATNDTHRYVDRESWKATCDFVGSLTRWAGQGNGWLTAVNDAQASEARKGSDTPILPPGATVVAP